FVRTSWAPVDGDAPARTLAPAVPEPHLALAPALPAHAVPSSPLPWGLIAVLLVLGVSEALLLRMALSIACASWAARTADDLDDDRLLDRLDAAHARSGL